jgi:hypothetical protein
MSVPASILDDAVAANLSVTNHRGRHTAWLSPQFPHRVHFLDNREQKYQLLWTSSDVTAICAFRFVILITSRVPAWETGPNREAKGNELDAPPLSARGVPYALDPI